MKRLVLGAAIFTALVFCVLLALSDRPLFAQSRGAGRPPSPRANRSQSDVRVVDLKGLEAAVAANRGKAVLVNFWAIWCEPCVAELPEFLETGREYRGRNAVVLTVSYDLMIPDVTRDEVLKKMRAFVAEHKIDAPVFIYDAPDYDAINQRFGLPGPVPATIAIDATGKIVHRHAGQATRQQFREMMRKALGSSQ
jgi:thiol-disulfide isomerase/thioredoxin